MNDYQIRAEAEFADAQLPTLRIIASRDGTDRTVIEATPILNGEGGVIRLLNRDGTVMREFHHQRKEAPGEADNLALGLHWIGGSDPLVALEFVRQCVQTMAASTKLAGMAQAVGKDAAERNMLFAILMRRAPEMRVMAMKSSEGRFIGMRATDFTDATFNDPRDPDNAVVGSVRVMHLSEPHWMPADADALKEGYLGSWCLEKAIVPIPRSDDSNAQGFAYIEGFVAMVKTPESISTAGMIGVPAQFWEYIGDGAPMPETMSDTELLAFHEKHAIPLIDGGKPRIRTH